MTNKKSQRVHPAVTMIARPEMIGREVGFEDLTGMHGEWIREMVFGEGDFTLQAHRGSYKSSCLAVAIAMMMVIFPRRNIIFLRKTDDDVAEMMRMVGKILRSETMQDLTASMYQTELTIVSETTEQISTNLWTSPMGAPQLLGLGIRASITGKHAYYVITDDICNRDDRMSKAERERTKTAYDELQNIRNRGGRIINLGTPWHKDDVFTRMPNIHKYDCYTTGLISKEKLQEIRESMPSFLFAANYELKHIASADAIFTTAPVFTEDVSLIYDGYAHIDAAYGGSDYTALTCARRQEDGRIVMYGRLWQKDVLSVMEEIFREVTRLRCGMMYCEDNGDKGFLKREIFRQAEEWEMKMAEEEEARRIEEMARMEQMIRAGELDPEEAERTENGMAADEGAFIWPHTYTERQNKMIKIESYLREAWGRIVFLEGTDREYLDQILDYTEYAEHDDAPDSAATMCRFFSTYRWSG